MDLTSYWTKGFGFFRAIVSQQNEALALMVNVTWNLREQRFAGSIMSHGE